ncbi:MAG: hypothetical protein LBU73_02020 [Helicobacteraceae bacterium]|jgi:flagellar basal body-associated protein FliL|nr:hypothetical protein [Helicobacteraceae bacterium]
MLDFIFDAAKREHKLLITQISAFGCFLALILVVGAIVYSKTTVHERENAVDVKRNISDSFQELQRGRQ